MKENNNFFSKQLKKIMAEHNFSQVDLENKTGISQTVISRWCRGEAMPTFVSIKKLAQAFNVPLNYFFENTNTNKDDFYKSNLNEKIFKVQEEILKQLAEIKEFIAVFEKYQQKEAQNQDASQQTASQIGAEQHS